MVCKTINVALAISAAFCGLAQAAVEGFDISHWQSSVDFAKAASSGANFVIIKVCDMAPSLYMMKLRLSGFVQVHLHVFSGNRRHRLYRRQVFRPLHWGHKG